MFKVDIFLPKKRPFDLSVRQRVRKDKLPISEDHALFNMESPEDVILMQVRMVPDGWRSF
jgi:hypothetical protein